MGMCSSRGECHLITFIYVVIELCGLLLHVHTYVYIKVNTVYVRMVDIKTECMILPLCMLFLQLRSYM